MQSSPAAEALQGLHNLEDELRVKRERVRDFHKISRQIVFSENYVEGNLALILDMKVLPQGDKEAATFADPLELMGDNVALLIFQNNSSDSDHMHQWNEQLVLIENIKAVNCPDVVIPSRVWFYFGNNPFVEVGAGDIYLSLFERSCKFLCSPKNGELGKVVRRNVEMTECCDPRKIKSGSEVVNSITNNQSQFSLNCGGIRQVVSNGALNSFVSDLEVVCEGRSVSIGQCEDTLFKLRDVLVGPFNLEM